VIGVGLVCSAVSGLAREWPDRPITLVVPAAAGSGADTLARVLAAALSKSLGQTVVVDNRAGANGALGAQAAARSAADGYTLFLGSATTHAVNPALYGARLAYRPDELDAVATTGAGPVLWLVSSASRARTVAEYQAWVRANPAAATCAHGNSVGQVACALFGRRFGTESLSVPYRSTPQALNDLAGGQVSSAFADTAVAMPLIESGHLRAIAVAQAERTPILPNVPSMRELGHPDLQMLAWTALFVPRGTPEDVRRRLNHASVAALSTPEAQAQHRRSGGVQLPYNVEQTTAFVRREAANWQAFLREAPLPVE
jgi:tripartite-type tricarboxylate transporter receptor subunit TctC